MNPIQIIITAVNQASPILAAISEQLNNLQGTATESQHSVNALIESFEGFKKLLIHNEIIQTAIAFQSVTGAIGELQHIAHPIFEGLIAQNIELRSQVQSVAAQLASTQSIKVDGSPVEGALNNIKAAIDPVKEQIQNLQQDALSLSGVTSTELVGAFQALAQQSGVLGINLAQAEKLTISMEAAATTLGIPLQTAQNEINAIANGEINSYNTLAKTLGINNEQLRILASQGKLYDYIQTKTEALRQGQQLAAESFSGVTSNIREIQQLILQAAGAPVLDLLLKDLNAFYNYLKTLKPALEEFLTKLTTGFVEAFDKIQNAFQVLAPVFGTLMAAFGNLANAGVDIFVSSLKLFADALVVVLTIARPFLAILAQVAEAVGSLLNTPVGEAAAQFILLSIAVQRLTPSLLDLAANGLMAASKGFGTLVTLLSGSVAENIAVFNAGLGKMSYALNALKLEGLRDSFDGLSTVLTKFQVSGKLSFSELGGAVQQLGTQLGQLAIKAGLVFAAFEVLRVVLTRFQDGGAQFKDSAGKIEAKLSDIEKASGKTVASLSQLKDASGEPPPTDWIDTIVAKTNGLKQSINSVVGLPKDFLTIPTNAQKQLGDAKLGVDALSESTFKAVDASIALSNKIKSGVKPSGDEMAATQKALATTIEEIKRQQDALDPNKLGKKGYEEIKAQLETQLQLAEKQQNSLTKLGSQTEFANKPLEKLGDTFQQLNLKAQAFQKTIDSPFNKEKLAEAEKGLIETTKQQVELGQISAEQAKQRLDAIAKDQRVEVDVQQSAQKAITDLTKKEGEQQLADLKSKDASINAAIAAQTVSQFKGEQELTENKKHQLELRLQLTKEALEREQSEGRGQGEYAKQLRQQEADLQGELTSTTAKGAEARKKEQIKEAQESLTIAQSEHDAHLSSDSEFNKKKLELTKAELTLELQQLEERKKKLKPDDVAGLKEIEAQESSIRTKLVKANDDYYKAQSELRTKFVSDEVTENESAYAQKLETEEQYNQKSLALTKEKINIELAELARQEKELPKDDKEGREAINAKRVALQKELFDAEEKVAQSRYQAQQRHYGDLQKIQDAALATGKTSEQEYAQESFKITQGRLDAELAEVQRKRFQIKSGDKQALEDLAAQEADIQAKREKALEDFEQRRVQIIDRAQKKAMDLVQQTETESNTRLQKAELDGALRHDEVEALRLNTSKDRIQQEIALEQQKLQQLQALPPLADPTKEEDRQSQIRASRLKTSQLTQSLLSNEMQRREAAEKLYESAIDRAVKARQNAATITSQALQREQTLQENLKRELDDANKILNAKKEILNSLSGYYQGELNILKETASSEQEKKKITELQAALKLQSLTKQAQIEREILETNLAQKAAQLEQEQIRLRIQAISEKSATLQAEAELKKTEAKAKIGQATSEDVEAAKLNLQARQEAQVGVLQQQALLEQQKARQGQEAQVERAKLAQSQQTSYDQARLEFANSRGDAGAKQRDIQALRNEVSQRLLGVGGSTDIGALGQAEVQRTESAYFGAGLGTATQPALLPLQLPQYQQPQAPNVDSLRTLVATQTKDETNKLGNKEFQDGITRMTNVLQNATVTPNITLQNNFTGDDVNSETFAQKVQQQSINAQVTALKLLRQQQG